MKFFRIRKKKFILAAPLSCIVLIFTFADVIPASDVINAGIYFGKGVGEFPGKEAEYAGVLKVVIESIAPNICASLITAEQIHSGILEELDVIVFPGGRGEVQYASLGDEGRAAVTEFAAKGGGYLGICAGAFLGQTYDKGARGSSLNLIKATVYNKSRNWARGAGLIKVKPTAAGLKLFPELTHGKNYLMHYYNGPVLVPLTKKKSDRYIDLMTFVSDVHHDLPNGKGKNETPGKSLLLLGKNGRGRVVLMSGHPEFTPGFRWLLPRMIEIAAKRPPGRYPKRFIQPKKFRHEIMFDKNWISAEKNYLAQLGDDDPNVKKNALVELSKMGSKIVTEQFSELLRCSDPTVRIETAKAIVFYDYFPSIRDIESTLENEVDAAVISEFRAALKHLSGK